MIKDNKIIIGDCVKINTTLDWRVEIILAESFQDLILYWKKESSVHFGIF
jgi:hypothetical protein